MDNKDQIKDLFADKLGQMEMPVRPELWTSISSQIGSGAVAGSSAAGLSLVSKIIIGVSVVAASTVAGVYLLNDKEEKQVVEANKELVANNTSENFNQLVDVAASDNVVAVNKTVRANLPQNVIQELNDEEFGSEDLPLLTIPAPIKIPVYPKERGGEQTNGGVGYQDGQSNGAGNVANGVSVPVDDPHVDEQAIQNQVSDITLRNTNVFSPNGDGYSDEFFIESSGELFDFNLVILDRTNKVIFQSSDPNFKWDGRNQGGDFVDAGTYLYYLTAVDANGKKVAKANTLTINR